jgi:hypothetical protein
VCGQLFDPWAFQVIISSIAGSFDSLTCAVQAESELGAKHRRPSARTTVGAELLPTDTHDFGREPSKEPGAKLIKFPGPRQ